jgi:exodeoxyribonuclease VII small subunit
MPAKPAAPPSHTFETAMQRLEKVVEEMGSDQLPLDDLITRYEEGIQLVKVCEERLQAVEKRVEILSRTASGDPALVPFEPEKKTTATPRDDVSLF